MGSSTIRGIGLRLLWHIRTVAGVHIGELLFYHLLYRDRKFTVSLIELALDIDGGQIFFFVSSPSFLFSLILRQLNGGRV